MDEFLSHKPVAENASYISNCDCPPSCHQVSYDATVSGSMLSEMFIHTLLSRSFGRNIKEHYLAALDVRSRVETESMMTLQQLAALERTYQTFSTIIDVDLLNPATSIVGDIYSAVDVIVQLTHDSVQQFRTHLLQNFTDTYEKKVDFFVRRIVTQGNEFLAHHASSDNASFSNVDVNTSAAIFCEQFVKFWKWFAADYRHPFKSWTYYDKKICNTELFDACEKFPAGLCSETEQRKMPEQTKVWLRCMTEFREFLDDVESWLKTQATLNSSLPLQKTSDKTILMKLRNNTNYLQDTCGRFRLHNVTKVWANLDESCFALSSECQLCIVSYIGLHICIQLTVPNCFVDFRKKCVTEFS